VSASGKAASFDCRHAKSEIDQAICRNQELSDLDSRLSTIYSELLAAAKDGEPIRKSQRAWASNSEYASNSRDSCEADKTRIEACLVSVYKDRIKLLSTLTESVKSDAKVKSGSRYELKSVSAKYDFVIQTFGPCEADSKQDYSSCENPGVVQVFRKGAVAPLQIIAMENIFLSFSRNKTPLVNSAALYDYQGVINVGDFNFDGEEDFAIQNGNHGSYGGPSYDVYLFSKKAGSFKYNAGMSELVENTLGFFQVDDSSKRLMTLAKSGCCYHESTVYEVINDNPVPVSRVIDDASKDQRYDYVYEEKWADGKWKRVKTERSRQEGYCEDELEDAARSMGHYVGTGETRVCKLLPYAKKQGIVALQYPSDGKDRDKSATGIDVFLVSLSGGDILGSYSDPNEFKSDYLEQLQVDTAPYLLRPELRGFSVRSHFRTKKGDNRYSLMTLFIRNRIQLVPVLRQLVMYRREENVETMRTIDIGKTSSNGYADIIIHETAKQLRNAADEGKNTTAAPASSGRTFTLRFDGKQYVVPAELLRYP